MKLTINIDDSMNVTVTRPCDACEVDVPTNEHCGDDGQYLCPDCYGQQRANQMYIHDWLIFNDGSHPLTGRIAIHKDVVDPNCLKDADCSSPSPDWRNTFIFGPSTSAHMDVNHVYTLVDEGYIDGKKAHLIFKEGGAS